jgi:hypothetical protein
MSSSIPLQVGETLQTLSINRSPSPAHDINPSTAASEKIPVKVSRQASDIDSYSSSILGSDIDEEEYMAVHPTRDRASLPPLPDLRFEQSYLASIRGADTYGKIAYITIRDQVCFPNSLRALWQRLLY